MKRMLLKAALTLHIILFTASTVWAAEEQIFAGFTATGGTQNTSYVGYQAASAATAVSYIDENGNTQKCTNYTVVTSSTGTTWAEGWYVVNSTVEIGARVSVSGHVRLILVDGCSLSIGSGIEVNDPNSITIYGQSANSGRLNCGASQYDAAIGGNKYQRENASASRSYGTITINGGTIEVTGGYWAAGIGSGTAKNNDWKAGGTITINGGNITATGGRASAGIGGGYSSSTGTITINAGNINATAGVARFFLCHTFIKYGAKVQHFWQTYKSIPLLMQSCGSVEVSHGKIRVRPGGAVPQDGGRSGRCSVSSRSSADRLPRTGQPGTGCVSVPS